MSFEMKLAIKLFPRKLFLTQNLLRQEKKLLFHGTESTKMLSNLFKCRFIDVTQQIIDFSINGLRTGG